MTVTATAKRRRRQAVVGYTHIARLGRGGNNRSMFRKPDTVKATRREQELRERQKVMVARRGRR